MKSMQNKGGNKYFIIALYNIYLLMKMCQNLSNSVVCLFAIFAVN